MLDSATEIFNNLLARTNDQKKEVIYENNKVNEELASLVKNSKVDD